MPNIDPARQPKKEDESITLYSRITNITNVASYLTFTVCVWAGVALGVESLMGPSKETKERAQLKAKQLNGLNMDVDLINKQAKFLDTFIAAAKAAVVHPSECTFAYNVMDSSRKDMESLSKDISVLTRFNVITATEAASYRMQGRKAYDRVVTKMGALDVACDDLFNAAAVASANQRLVPASEWWQKPEFSIDLNK